MSSLEPFATEASETGQPVPREEELGSVEAKQPKKIKPLPVLSELPPAPEAEMPFSLQGPKSPKAYWRSLQELEGTPEFEAYLHREFPQAASEYPEGVSRRRWMQLMGASFALGLAGCQWEKEIIAPFSVRPSNRIPGEPQYYATAMEIAGATRGLLVTSRDGRPIKIEGNPEHPESNGGSSAFCQASILHLYDPDRSENIVQRTNREDFVRDWLEFEAFANQHFKALQSKKGAGLRILSEATTSPSVKAMEQKFADKFPDAKWVTYEPVSREQERLATEAAFGSPHDMYLKMKDATIIAAFDTDLFNEHPASSRLSREYASRRAPEEGEMNRLYVFESQFSSTGLAADHRVPVQSRHIGLVLALLEQAVDQELDGSAEPIEEGRAKEDPKTLPLREKIKKTVRALASDLMSHQGESLIVVGPRQPISVHLRAHRLNRKLGNAGKTVLYKEVEESPNTGTAALKDLVTEMQDGKVNTLLMIGGNPVYNSPVDLDFAEALKKVGTSIHLSEYEDETSLASTWHVAKAHSLECWEDMQSVDGTITVAQPLIAPLLKGKSTLEVLALITQDDLRDGQEIVRRTMKDIFTEGDFEKTWRKVVHDGLYPAEPFPTDIPNLELGPVELQLKYDIFDETVKNGDLEIVFTPSETSFDGRFANNGWLQETPNMLTKVTWDNVAVMSPKTAEAFGIVDNTKITLQYKDRELTIPVYLMPGQAYGSVGVSLGYGRTAAGKVGGLDSAGIDPVGVNVYSIRTSENPEFDGGLSVLPTGESYPLATTQDHWAIDAIGQEGIEERVGDLVREGTVEEFEEEPHFAEHRVHHPPLKSLWEEHEYKGYKWGMSVDLSKCIGCNACLVSCTAENNVPVVGKEQVSNGREMHWLRLDRYFSGNPEDPEVATQPLSCHHCENAPCEQVCPVAATVHSRDGLNAMAYNRCIGTRYCANNCPYKVRRFNYFDYTKPLVDPERKLATLAVNPEVTVRTRGVMEKCTYCTQRIEHVKIQAKNERRPIKDGELKSACQEACPTDAIQFGDLNDKESRVLAAHNNPRAYAMLSELNVKPRTKYLARIRNPHPSLSMAPAHAHHHSHDSHDEEAHEDHESSHS
ncbi:Molybdopterin oxidoreductase iron-sulfur binding subunit [Planctomycetales bacterium 10988]|nr:Molybdopterin oxidoreductase iron-sulfur binding subunit [Planctomycetales bacterium 10988]